MKKHSFLLILLFLLFSATSIFATTNQGTPLTLLNPVQKTGSLGKQTPIQSDTIHLHDIYAPVAISTYPPYLLIGGAVLLTFLLLALMYWVIKKRRKSGPPPISPWQKALAELAQARELFTARQSLLYMSRISEILRHYIESRFAIRSTRQTTEEFLRDLQNAQNNELLQNSQDELQSCLEQCDLAKFAHRVPDKQIMTQMEEAVTAFVEKTTPITDQNGGKA